MEDPRHGEEAETELSGEAPGFKAKIRGYRLIDVIGAVLLLWAFAVKPYMDGQRDDVRAVAMAKEHAMVITGQEKIIDALNEFSYIATLPQDQKQLLNLGMPTSLREKLYDRPVKPPFAR